MGVKLGFNCKMFRNTGTWGSPTWVAVPLVRDLKVSGNFAEWEATVRGSGGNAQAEPTELAWSAEGQLLWDPSDASMTAIVTAAMARSSVDIALLDGAASGASSQGVRALWKFFKFERGEELKNGVVIDFMIKPCYEITNLPAWSTFT